MDDWKPIHDSLPPGTQLSPKVEKLIDLAEVAVLEKFEREIGIVNPRTQFRMLEAFVRCLPDILGTQPLTSPPPLKLFVPPGYQKSDTE